MTDDDNHPAPGSYRTREPRCPACGEVLQVERTGFFGLSKRLPPSCSACGVTLRYDLAGGIHVARDPQEPEDR